MKHRITAVAILAASFALPWSGMAFADELNQQTIATFSAPFEIPGKVLPAGQYIFKLAMPNTSLNIVQIVDAKTNHVEATLLTVPDQRFDLTDKTIMMFAERSGNSPEALKEWFYPGRQTGDEFVYPHDRAVQLARANHEAVLSTQSDSSKGDGSTIKTSQVKAITPDGDEVEPAQVTAGSN
jgi:hypothetical protein